MGRRDDKEGKAKSDVALLYPYSGTQWYDADEDGKINDPDATAYSNGTIVAAGGGTLTAVLTSQQALRPKRGRGYLQ